MKKYQTVTSLWLVVTVAIPLATQAGCANNEPVANENQNTAKPVNNNDPCRQGPITRKSAKENFFHLMYLPESSEAQCISLCKQEFTKRKTQSTGKFDPLVTIERFKASNCNVEYYPHAPREPSSGNLSGGIRCDVDYTAAYSPYTCPRISPPLPR